MVEEKVKKREWVKNAAIIFLSIMLVLTFFSNTFLNYSLPEVSTKYAESGTINAKIRGSGAVKAAGTYEVNYEQARKVETICVKIGQTVAPGDVLFILEEGDSDELESAKNELELAEINYEKALLEAGKDKYTAESRAVADAREALSDARAELSVIRNASKAIKEAENKLAAAQAKYDELYNHLKELEHSSGDTAEIEKVKGLLADAQAKAAAAEAHYNSLPDGAEKDEAKKTWDAWEQAVIDYTAKLNDLLNGTATKPSEGTGTGDGTTTPGDGTGTPGEGTTTPPATGENHNKEYEELYNKLVTAGEARDAAQKELDAIKEKYGSAASGSIEAAEAAVEGAERQYDNARDALSAAMENEEIDEKIDQINLKQQQQAINKLKEKIADLATDTSNEVTAKVGGVVSEINVAPGGMTGTGSPLAVLELSDRGYTVSFTVSAEQAQKVTVGDTAQVENYYWWGSEITAVLESIKTEPQSGGKSKVLTFTVSGDVEAGTNLNLSLGQKSQNYGALVPNSAVRSDTNGSYVLVLMTKSSPLGNRYVATRVDVKVLASDDVNSAVSGISSGDYVITTSSKPIESGTLVRMAEG